MDTVIKDNTIEITNYPFTHSCVIGSPIINSEDILGVNLSANPVELKLQKEIIFVNDSNAIQEFVALHNIPVYYSNDIWNWITLPVCLGYDDQIFNYYDNLYQAGLSKDMVDTVRFIFSLLLEVSIDEGNFQRHGLYNTLVRAQNCVFWKERNQSLFELFMGIYCCDSKLKESLV